MKKWFCWIVNLKVFSTRFQQSDFSSDICLIQQNDSSLCEKHRSEPLVTDESYCLL